jgi:hypothetical protein
MALGTTQRDNTIGWLVRNATPSGALGTVTVGLHSGTPGNAGTGSEFASAGGYNYARGTAGVFGAPDANGTATGTASVAWSSCPAGTVTHCTLWAGAVFVVWAALATAQPVSGGNNFSLSSLSFNLS